LQVFIYRGDAFEKLSTFESRMMCRYLQAELLKTLGKPSEEIRNSNKQCIFDIPYFDGNTIY